MFLRRFLITPLACAGLCGFDLPSSSALDLSRQGQPQAAIVLPEAPSRAEQFVAEQLQTYLEAISGAQLRITTEAPEGFGRLYIGNHPANAEVSRTLEENQALAKKYERYAVVVDGQALHLVAPTSQGLLYAGWDFLESLGIAWIFPTRNGTYIPEEPTLSAPDRAHYHAPALEFRSSTNYIDVGEKWFLSEHNMAPRILHEEIEQGINAAHLFAMRMRLNTMIAFEPQDAYRILGTGHSYAVYLPIERYGKDHPEWFAFTGGERQKPGNPHWQLCLTNRDSAKTFAENALADVAKFRAQGVPASRILLSVSPNDWEVYCECPDCLKLVDDEPAGGPSSRVLHYANLVAERVHAVEPDVKITYYVYHRYGRIPTKVKPARGVYPFITGWTSNDSLAVNNAAPMTHPQRNRIFRQVFDWMAENADGVFVYPYYGHWDIVGPYPMLTQMNTDFKEMARRPNFLGMNSESHLHWGTQTANLWMFPRLLVDPNLDAAQTLQELCRKAFGSAGNDIYRLTTRIQEQMDALHYVAGTGIEVTNILPRAMMAEGNRVAERTAARLADMDEATRWRTELWLDGWRATHQFARVAHILKSGNRPEQMDEAQAIIRDFEAFARTEQGRFVLASRCALGIVLSQGIKPFKEMLSVNLNAVPVGQSSGSFGLQEGGPLKLFSRLDTVRAGLWGFYLPSGEKGTLHLTLRPVEGHAFRKASFQLNGLSRHLTVSAVDARGRATELFHAKEPGATGPIVVPEALLGQQPLRLAITSDNSAGEGDNWFLTSFSFDLDVE